MSCKGVNKRVRYTDKEFQSFQADKYIEMFGHLKVSRELISDRTQVSGSWTWTRCWS